MKIEIITPSAVLYSGEARLIKLPGTKGNFEILKNHAPIISTLEKGLIKIIDKAEKICYFDISGGVVECFLNNVSVVLESGILVEK